MQIRPVAASDYQALARIATAAFAGVPHFADELQAEDEEVAIPGLRFARWVAEVDGQVVGTACYFQYLARFHPQKFWMDAYVHPDFQNRGIGSALLDLVLTTIRQQHGAISVRTFTREDIPHALRYMEQRGFTVVKRTWKSALDVTAFDFTPYAGVTEQVLATGIAIRSMSELQSAPGWERRYLDLYNAIQTDVPDIDPAVAVSFEQFQESRLNSPRFLPAGHFIALDGDAWIGMCTLWTVPEPDHIDVGLTGVLPEYRRRGIALALKLRSIAFAKANGYRQMSTQNASTNTGMLAINNQLGFVREPAWLHLLREW